MSILKLNGRDFILLFLLLFGLSAQAKQPNIVFILVDDLDTEVFSHADKVNALITAQGTQFANHFVSMSLCCPSRASILRGQYAHNTGIYTNVLPGGGFAKFYSTGLENSTVATWLQDAGYRTALFGKYLNGYPDRQSGLTYIPPGWSHWISPNGGKPYDEYNYSLNENGKTVAYGNQDEDYLVDVLSNKAVSFIRNTKAHYPNKPFFMYVAPYVPHAPATPPRRYDHDFPNIKAPRPASFNKAIIGDKPAWLRAKLSLTGKQIKRIDRLYQKRMQTMLAVGDLVENVVNVLKELGELNHTYIIFTSDNGFHQGQHQFNSGKNTAFEEDIKVPLVVRGPGVPVGASVNAITANVDFAPTLAEIAGVTPPSFVDGRSLGAFLAGSAPTAWRLALLLEHGGPSITSGTAGGLLEPQDPYDIQAEKTGESPIFVGLRSKAQAFGSHGPINYVEYDTGERELYDLSVDPHQLNNTYSTADLVLKDKLKAYLASLSGASGQALRDAEQTPP
ncbi:MAG: sulfatase [Methylovulum sp.]|nr:sulfatase [Methylovulum sp.]